MEKRVVEFKPVLYVHEIIMSPGPYWINHDVPPTDPEFPSSSEVYFDPDAHYSFKLYVIDNDKNRGYTGVIRTDYTGRGTWITGIVSEAGDNSLVELFFSPIDISDSNPTLVSYGQQGDDINSSISSDILSPDLPAAEPETGLIRLRNKSKLLTKVSNLCLPPQYRDPYNPIVDNNFNGGFVYPKFKVMSAVAHQETEWGDATFIQLRLWFEDFEGNTTIGPESRKLPVVDNYYVHSWDSGEDINPYAIYFTQKRVIPLDEFFTQIKTR